MVVQKPSNIPTHIDQQPTLTKECINKIIYVLEVLIQIYNLYTIIKYVTTWICVQQYGIWTPNEGSHET